MHSYFYFFNGFAYAIIIFMSTYVFVLHDLFRLQA